jgi:predicted O-methyltransferase YrrM
MTFTEDWFGPASCAALSRLALHTNGLAGRVVEVGCWEGRSTIALANAAYPDTVHAVDTWAGSPGEISADLAAERDVFATFTANIAERTKGNVEAHRTGWRDYFNEDRGPIRFLHIDAEHTYEEVAANIAAAVPLMVAGGIICGDDAHHPPVIRAARELGDIHIEATLWVWEA